MIMKTQNPTVYEMAQTVGLTGLTPGSPLGCISLAACSNVTVDANVGMLIEPINGNPVVFLKSGDVHTFPYEAGSGTDHLRQRILASMFFTDAVDKFRRAPRSTPDALVIPADKPSAPRHRM
jgi:hypothetical protein